MSDPKHGTRPTRSLWFAGTALTAYSYEQDWLKVTTTEGVSAWVNQSVVRSAAAGRP